MGGKVGDKLRARQGSFSSEDVRGGSEVMSVSSTGKHWDQEAGRARHPVPEGRRARRLATSALAAESLDQQDKCGRSPRQLPGLSAPEAPEAPADRA